MKVKIRAILLILALIIPSIIVFQACGDEPIMEVYVNNSNEFITAIKSVDNGGTVILNCDIELSEEISISKKLILNLNEKTISNSSEIWSDAEDPNEDRLGLICVREGGDLTITGNGTIDALENDCYAIWLDAEDANLTIVDGNINGNVSAVYVRKGFAKIEGGKFNLKQLSSYDDSRYLLNCLDENYLSKANILVAGGVFENFNPAENLSEGQLTNYLEENCKVSALTKSSGVTFTVYEQTEDQ